MSHCGTLSLQYAVPSWVWWLRSQNTVDGVVRVHIARGSSLECMRGLLRTAWRGPFAQWEWGYEEWAMRWGCGPGRWLRHCSALSLTGVEYRVAWGPCKRAHGQSLHAAFSRLAQRHPAMPVPFTATARRNTRLTPGPLSYTACSKVGSDSD